MTGRLVYLWMAIAGALLGFTLEPLVGRLVTLQFGGAVHVWTVCVLVFQTVLLLAYVWTHGVARRFPLAHAAVVAAGLLFLPLDLVATPDPHGAVVPLVWTVLLQVGVPYFGLASAAVVAQTWVERRDLGSPWGLYAASNAGSLVGLFAYPFVVEPFVGLGAQRAMWSVGYAGYVVLVGLAAWQSRDAPARGADLAWPRAAQVARWTLLSGAASVLLLAVTSWVGTEYGSFPLLWTVPLGLYLGSFMLAFSERIPSDWLRPFWPDALAALALFASLAGEPAMHPLLYAAFLVACWQLHAALFRLRPEPSGLTIYYVVIALGGWIGGISVTLVAPSVFPGLWEFPLGLLLCAVALVLGGDGFDWGWFKRVHWRWAFSRATLVGTLLLLTGMWWNIQQSRGPVASVRSLYGVFGVRERTTEDGAVYRELMHGGTSHGSQYMAPDPRSTTPMSYYHPDGSNAEGLALRQGGRIAGVGLGTGAIAALARAGESVVFYELDPNAEHLARTWFTYLDDSPADIEVRIGDARLVLETEATVYDAILVDAFSGDGIPTHLLTVEAFQIYLDRLADDGVLVFHISNRFLDLRGVVAATAAEHDLEGSIREDRSLGGRDKLYGPAVSMVFSRKTELLDNLSDQWVPLATANLPKHQPWTDDHVDLLQPLGLR